MKLLTKWEDMGYKFGFPPGPDKNRMTKLNTSAIWSGIALKNPEEE